MFRSILSSKKVRRPGGPPEIGEKDIASVLCVSTGGLGDAVLFSPVIAGARNAFPKASIDFLVSSPLAASVYEKSDIINRVYRIELAGKNRSSKTMRILAAALNGELKKDYDLGLFATGLNPMLAALLRALRVIRASMPAPTADECGTDAAANAALAGKIAGNGYVPGAFVPSDRQDERDLLARLFDNGIDPRRHALIAVYPSVELWHRPRLHPEVLLRVCGKLKAHIPGARVIAVGSAAEGRELRGLDVHRVLDANLAGALSIGAVHALFSMARLALCNDGGLMHVAGAAGCPQVAIMVNAPIRYSPPGSNTVVIRSEMDCCQGRYPRRPAGCKSPRCAQAVAQAPIFETALMLVESKAAQSN